jgi:hypothetical protein
VFPDLPYPGYLWRLNHHMGKATPGLLYQILWAGNKFAGNDDPSANINHYLIANNLWTPNVRADSGQPDAWRDYQQILSELGLIYSQEITPDHRITLTPLGLAFLDRSMRFSEIMTLQALRFQYPNGHHVQVSTQQRAEIAATPHARVKTYTQLQRRTGVLIRPAVLTWRVLRRLLELGSAAQVSPTEFDSYLMRCSKNSEYPECVEAIIRARAGGVQLDRLGQNQRRDAGEWMRFLRFTTLFEGVGRRRLGVRISNFGGEHAAEIDEMCTALETEASFWQPGTVSPADRQRWYAEFGGVDLSIPNLPQMEPPADAVQEELAEEPEEEEESPVGNLPGGGRIELHAFQGIHIDDSPLSNLTIESVSSAELTKASHRLHDVVVLLIAETCKSKGAAVFDDPGSVDLLVQHERREFIIEVKSVTPRNFISRLRYALGQVLHYDFLRAPDSQLPRRKVIALAANVPPDSWSVRFLNNHLDMDLLTLESGRLRVHSPSEAAIQLFG